MSANGRPPRRGDRYYRGHCPHGTWMALVHAELADDDTQTIQAACGCSVELTSREP